MAIYEANYGLTKVDHETTDAAKSAVEAHGSGYVVTFHRGSDGKDRSGAMTVYKDGAWSGVDIHR